ncbi:SBBP repeat-containing protein [Myxococcota bacterium]|nr:SBBP repeat-containing protein [Myxococcota bacterium]
MKSTILRILFLLAFTAFGCKTNTKAVSSCGDGIADPAEDCDDQDLHGATCLSLGFYRATGQLACTAECGYDTADCGGSCGDGGVDTANGEQCDGENLNNQTCESNGHWAGTLGCTADCRFDFSGCGGTCGDGIIATPDEDCDGILPNGATCLSAGFYQGNLRCGEDCRFDTSQCTGTCGDAIVQPEFGEDCDGLNLDTESCESLHYYDGQLACTAACRFDTSQCMGTCGDGVIDDTAGEVCDGDNFAGETCQTMGFYEGELLCTNVCSLDDSGCTLSCGDGVVQDAYGETCDPGTVPVPNCQSLDLFFGTLACSADCVQDASDCRDTTLWGTSSTDMAGGVAVDSAGSVYVAGLTEDTLDGTVHIGAWDLWLSKHDVNGQKLWTRQWGTVNPDSAGGLALASDGSIYVTAKVAGPLDAQTHLGGYDASLTKFNADGVRQWTRQWGTPVDDSATGAAVDAATGDIYVTGTTSGTLSGQTALGGEDVFLAKYDSAGVHQWTRQFGTAGLDNGHGVALDSAGSVYVAGVVSGALNSATFSGVQDAFIIKYSSTGVYQWTRLLGTSGYDGAFGIAADSNNFLYIAGETRGILPGQTFQGGIGDMFVASYDTSGARQWITQFGSTDWDIAYGVAVDAFNHVFVTGHTMGSMDGQPCRGVGDIVLSRFAAGDGAWQWTRQWGTTANESGQGVATDDAGHAYVVGFTVGSLNGLPYSGGIDAFLIYAP